MCHHNRHILSISEWQHHYINLHKIDYNSVDFDGFAATCNTISKGAAILFS